MNDVVVQICKQEIDDLLGHIENKFSSITLDNQTREYYRFIGKQILFFKHILMAYPDTYSVKVLISDFFNFILDDLNESTRYLYLNERSIIENYLRLVLKDDKYATHITSHAFDDLKDNNKAILSDAEYSKIRNEYIICCSFIHGGYKLADHLSQNFEECIGVVSVISKRTKNQRMNQTLDLFKILNKLFIYNNYDVVDNAFHRNKRALAYILGRQFQLIKDFKEIHREIIG